MSSKLERGGPVAEIIEDILKDEGYQVEFSFLPWPRAYKLSAEGFFDATAIWLHKEERDADFYFSDELLAESFVFFHAKDKAIDFEKLKNTQMVLNIGYSYGKVFDDLVLHKQIKYDSKVTHPKQNFRMLFSKRVAAFPMEKNVGYSVLQDVFTAEQIASVTHTVAPHIFQPNKSFLLFSKNKEGNVALMEKFNRRLRVYKESGRYLSYFPE